MAFSKYLLKKYVEAQANMILVDRVHGKHYIIDVVFTLTLQISLIHTEY